MVGHDGSNRSALNHTIRINPDNNSALLGIVADGYAIGAGAGGGNCELDGSGTDVGCVGV